MSAVAGWLIALACTGCVLMVGGSLVCAHDIGCDTLEDFPKPDPVDSVQLLANCATWLGGFMVISAMVLSYMYL